jgi:hypothetical protein
MFPSQRGEMGEEAVRNVFDLAQGGDGALEIPRIPENDRGGCGANLGSKRGTEVYTSAAIRRRARLSKSLALFCRSLEACSMRLALS